MNKLIFTTVVAGLLAISANAACTSTYYIGTASELDAFRDAVNAADGATSGICGIVTANINYAGTQVVASDLSGLANGEPSKKWSPIKMFAGTFDGQGHTISGLYYKVTEQTTENSKTSYYDAGFFANISGNAVIKNIRIEDSYFAADERAGGITADVKTGASVTIDYVSFKGIITTVTSKDKEHGLIFSRCNTLNDNPDVVNGHFGGLIGTVSDGAKVMSLSNSYNEGRITAEGECVNSRTSAGLVGSVQGEETMVNISNCYNAGTVERVSSDKGEIIAKNTSTSTTTTTNVTCTTTSSSCDKEVANVEAMVSSFNEQIEAQKNAEVAKLAEDANASGITFSVEGTKLVATITDATNNFALDKDVFVDEVRFNRAFTNNKSATFALPFTISASAVTGGTFYKLSEIKPKSDERERDTIVGSGVTTLEAYKPYLVKPDAVGGSIAVTGGATLKATTNAALVDEFADNWTFVTVLDRILWTKTDNADEMRRVYYFAGQEAGGEVPGNFVNLYNTYSKANQKPLRAYLRYTGEMPAGCVAALCKAAAVEELPEEFVVQFVEAPVVNEEVVEEISSIDNPSEEIDSSENTQGIAQPFRTPANLQETRWFDLKGRDVNNKPTSHGSFIKNGTPVILK